jgi:peptidyl-prolyl cis-trans isomerase C
MTPIPLAAIVNGEPILLFDYEMELERAKAARGIEFAATAANQESVLKALVDRRLLAQAARAEGMTVEETLVTQKLTALSLEVGDSNMQQWLQENFYSEDTFRSALKEEMLAGMMIKKLVETVPESALQAHARHILVASPEEAQQILAQLRGGAEFSDLAQLFSLDPSTRPAGGDLGWFAQGTLTLPALEEVIFALQPGQISEVVESELGYHIAQLIELEERPLPRETILAKQEQLVENWLTSQWEDSQIQILVVFD